MKPILLDGPMGTVLEQRGASTEGPWWSARALLEAPGLVGAIHADYASAGATVHSTATFRTTRRTVGEGWRELVAIATRLAREAVPADHRVAGSIAPLEDCYRPDLSPPDPGPEHAELARALVEEGVDLLLVETFPHVGEAVAAVRAARATGAPVWCSLTAGYRADLLTVDEVRRGAAAVVEAGAEVVLVNCVPSGATLPYVRALAGHGVPFGAYANAGEPHHGVGWTPSGEGPERYLAHARTWIEAGASVIGGCCGTGPEHIAALRRWLDTENSTSGSN